MRTNTTTLKPDREKSLHDIHETYLQSLIHNNSQWGPCSRRNIDKSSDVKMFSIWSKREKTAPIICLFMRKIQSDGLWKHKYYCTVEILVESSNSNDIVRVIEKFWYKRRINWKKWDFNRVFHFLFNNFCFVFDFLLLFYESHARNTS